MTASSKRQVKSQKPLAQQPLAKRQPVGGAACWRGQQLMRDSSWSRPLEQPFWSAIDTALTHCNDVPWQDITRDSFALPESAEFFAELLSELTSGTGVVRLSGLPLQRYSAGQLQKIFFGIGVHLGVPVAQNGARGFLREIQDNSASGGTRVDSASALRWHNDRADLVGLLCVRDAAVGGTSKIVSVPAIHDEMLAREPESLEILYRNFYRFSPSDEIRPTEGCYALPVFSQHQGHFSSHYSRTYIDQAVGVAGVPSLSPAQIRALDLLSELADELCVEMALAPGDMQWLNNHVIYHGRTPFKDRHGQGAGRLLYRQWLSFRGASRVSEQQAKMWGRAE